MLLEGTVWFVTAMTTKSLGWSNGIDGITTRWLSELWFECAQIHLRAGVFELGIVYGIAVLVGFLLLKGSFF